MVSGGIRFSPAGQDHGWMPRGLRSSAVHFMVTLSPICGPRRHQAHMSMAKSPPPWLQRIHALQRGREGGSKRGVGFWWVRYFLGGGTWCLVSTLLPTLNRRARDLNGGGAFRIHRRLWIREGKTAVLRTPTWSWVQPRQEVGDGWIGWLSTDRMAYSLAGWELRGEISLL